MTLESQIFDALKGLVANRVFPDVAPDAVLPYITYQQVGGQAVNFTDGTIPDRSNARIQINVWAATRLEASRIGAEAEGAIRAATALQPTVLSARVGLYDDETKARGTMQDFDLWY
jgi:hypothetical protein